MCIDGGGSVMCCLGSSGACITPNVDYEGNAVSDGCGMVCNVGNANNWPTVAKSARGLLLRLLRWRRRLKK